MVDYYVNRLKRGADNHSTLPTLAGDLANFQPTIVNYLKVVTKTKIPDALKPFRAFLTVESSVLEPSFKQIATGGLFVACRDNVEQTESRLTRMVFRSPGDTGGLDYWQLAEHLAWVKLVRLCIVCQIIESLDWAVIWNTVDGDAGWWLVDQIERLTQGILQHNLFQEMEMLQALPQTFLADMGIDRVLPRRKVLEQLVKTAGTWRDGCSASAACTVEDIGIRFPWTFAPIELQSSPNGIDSPKQSADGGTTTTVVLPQLYARKAATRRLQIVKDSWSSRRERLIESHIITRQKEFKFALIAGSLAHGGQHWPHETHRNGSVFDIDLTYVPDLIKEFGPASLKPSSQLAETGNDILEEPDRPLDAATLTVDPGPRPQEWNFPPSRREHEYLAVCMAFTECIYLSFPSSIIYASRNITGGAKVRLLSRLDIMKERADPIDQEVIDILSQMRELISAINPAPYAGKTLASETKLRYGHRNHWHISYNPNGLGDEDKIPSKYPDLAQRIESTINGMQIMDIPGKLWKLDTDSQVSLP